MVSVGLVLSMSREAPLPCGLWLEDTLTEDRMGPRKPSDYRMPASQHSELRLWSLASKMEAWSPSLTVSTSCLSKQRPWLCDVDSGDFE